VNGGDPPVLYLLERDLAWWPALAATAAGAGEARRSRAALVRALVEARAADPATALADALLYGGCDAWVRASDAPGVRSALVADVAQLARAVRRLADAPATDDGVALERLAPAPTGEVADLRERVLAGAPAEATVDHVLAWRREHGGGPLGRFRALRWTQDGLVGVAPPAAPSLERMVDLEAQVAPLLANTEAFLAGRPAMHALLYGPRGSGKSTVVRGLLTRFASQGLRLVDVPAAALAQLPDLLDALRDRSERFLLFVDDLSFEAGDVRYHPLKTLLEGSVEARPDHVRLYATSNRRHLVQERLRDRPDPLDDDVHVWDTQNERLALADRFGLLVTFPSADRRRFLTIVRALAERDGVRADDLEARADRFARAGNGYSGRTAQQFLDAFQADLA
jgi:predicted AAA+ superfamily ATPase